MVGDYLKRIGKVVLPIFLAASLSGAVSSKADILGYWFKDKNPKIEARGRVNDCGRLSFDRTGEGEFYPFNAGSDDVGFKGSFGNLEDMYLKDANFNGDYAVFEYPSGSIFKNVEFRCPVSYLTDNPKESYTWRTDLHLARSGFNDYSFSNLEGVVEYLGNTSGDSLTTNYIARDIESYLGDMECSQELEDALYEQNNTDLFDLMHLYTYGGNEE